MLSTKKQLVFVTLAVVSLMYIPGSQNAPNLNHAGLLEAIAQGESKGNYNAYYGSASNTDIIFTSMTVNEVLAWQDNFVQKGNPSSAVGKYQFVRPTLNGLVERLGIDRNAHFDEQMQDRLAVALLERRGLHDFAKGKITREQFAHNLSKEWAALPRVLGDNPHASFYAGDGLNKVQVSIEDINKGIDSLQP